MANRLGEGLTKCAIKERFGTVALVGYKTSSQKVFLQLASSTAATRDRLDNLTTGPTGAVWEMEVGVSDDDVCDLTMNDDGTYTVVCIVDSEPAVYHGDLLNGFSAVTD